LGRLAIEKDRGRLVLDTLNDHIEDIGLNVEVGAFTQTIYYDPTRRGVPIEEAIPQGLIDKERINE